MRSKKNRTGLSVTATNISSKQKVVGLRNKAAMNKSDLSKMQVLNRVSATDNGGRMSPLREK